MEDVWEQSVGENMENWKGAMNRELGELQNEELWQNVGLKTVQPYREPSGRIIIIKEILKHVNWIGLAEDRSDVSFQCNVENFRFHNKMCLDQLNIIWLTKALSEIGYSASYVSYYRHKICDPLYSLCWNWLMKYTILLYSSIIMQLNCNSQKTFLDL
jgi:hypothetical protein